jgi:hypothetical protein
MTTSYAHHAAEQPVTYSLNAVFPTNVCTNLFLLFREFVDQIRDHVVVAEVAAR